MGKLYGVTTGVLAALLLALGGCSDDTSSTDSGDGDGDGGSTADWLSADFPKPDYADYDRNLDCPAEVGPDDGTGAARGACCHRGKPNSAAAVEFDAREEAGDLEPDELLVIGFRLNESLTSNHPLTLGATPLPDLGRAARNKMEGSLLFQLGVPRSGGKRASGPGFLQIGGGHYNCDEGTFSFYGDTAAPVIDGTYPGADDAGRLAAHYLPTTIDATVDGVAGSTIEFADRPAGYTYSPTLDTDFALDYDVITRDFNILAFSTDPDEYDCHGVRDVDVWETHSVDMYEAYIPMAVNNTGGNGVSTLLESSVCTILAFGILATSEDIAALDCETTERCEPGTDGCRWKKLPDSLCPLTDAESEIFRCHVGDEAHEPEFEGDVVKCTADAPTMRDETEETLGQCCDPMGVSDTLPACNGWRTLNTTVAASAEIDDVLAPKQFHSCAP